MHPGNRYICSMLIRTAIAVLFAIAAAWSADPLAGLRFADGKARSLDQFTGQAVVLITCCSH